MALLVIAEGGKASGRGSLDTIQRGLGLSTIKSIAIHTALGILDKLPRKGPNFAKIRSVPVVPGMKQRCCTRVAFLQGVLRLLYGPSVNCLGATTNGRGHPKPPQKIIVS